MAAARRRTEAPRPPGLRRRGVQRPRRAAGRARRADRRLPDQPADPARPFPVGGHSRRRSRPTAPSPPRAASPMPASISAVPELAGRRPAGPARGHPSARSAADRDPRLPGAVDRPAFGGGGRRSAATVRASPATASANCRARPKNGLRTRATRRGRRPPVIGASGRLARCLAAPSRFGTQRLYGAGNIAPIVDMVYTGFFESWTDFLLQRYYPFRRTSIQPRGSSYVCSAKGSAAGEEQCGASGSGRPPKVPVHVP